MKTAACVCHGLYNYTPAENQIKVISYLNYVAGFQEQAEVLELFLTDFQMRLLWGSRGATENQALRYSKFDQVLTALSNKLEPPVRSQ